MTSFWWILTIMLVSGLYFLIGGLDALLAEVEVDERNKVLLDTPSAPLAACDTHICTDPHKCVCRFYSEQPATGTATSGGCGLASTEQRVRDALEWKRENEEPRLVSCALDGSTCTLNVNGTERYYTEDLK